MEKQDLGSDSEEESILFKDVREAFKNQLAQELYTSLRFSRIDDSALFVNTLIPNHYFFAYKRNNRKDEEY